MGEVRGRGDIVIVFCQGMTFCGGGLPRRVLPRVVPLAAARSRHFTNEVSKKARPVVVISFLKGMVMVLRTFYYVVCPFATPSRVAPTIHRLREVKEALTPPSPKGRGRKYGVKIIIGHPRRVVSRWTRKCVDELTQKELGGCD